MIDNEIVMMNTLYKERFPKATMQMEERLRNFILVTLFWILKTQARPIPANGPAVGRQRDRWTNRLINQQSDR